MVITNRELIETLKQFPPDAEIELDCTGYDADSVSLSVGGQTLLDHEFGFKEGLHFIKPPPIQGETVDRD